MSELPISIADYFTCHPIRSSERQIQSDRIDRDCHQLFEDLFSQSLTDREKRSKLTVFESKITNREYCRDRYSIDGAIDIVNYLRNIIFYGNAVAVDLPIEEREGSMLMRWVQYIRMDLRQGATIDELLVP